jgi:hypothetical protein
LNPHKSKYFPQRNIVVIGAFFTSYYKRKKIPADRHTYADPPYEKSPFFTV